MPRMKPQTMILSLLLSRWKQEVTTSFSSASLQMGRLYLRQKARLHWVQEEEEARGERKPGGGLGEGGLSWRGPRGMMVLFVKQVHLQKVGAAGQKGGEG